MTSFDADLDVLAVGEVMGMLDPDVPGPLEDAGHFRLRAAGAEANALITLSHLGHRTALISAVGDDPIGRLVLRTLHQQGVESQHVHVVDEGVTGVFFKERFPDGARRVYYYRTHSAAARLRSGEVALDSIPVPRILLVSGLSLGLGKPDGLADIVAQAIPNMAARGATVVFDANTRPGIWDGQRARDDFRRLRRNIDVLLAGDEELATLVPGDGRRAASALCDGELRAVFVKSGARGATLVESGYATSIPVFTPTRVVDPVGAGDAFAAGVVAGMLRGWSLLDSGYLGARLGAAAVASTGDWETAAGSGSAEQLLTEYRAALDGQAERAESILLTGDHRS